MHRSLFVHSEGHLGFSFQVLTIMNKVDIAFVCGFCIDISFPLLWVNSKEHDCGSYDIGMFNSGRNLQTAFPLGVLIFIAIAMNGLCYSTSL